MTKANPNPQYKPETPVLHLALELSATSWRLAASPGLATPALTTRLGVKPAAAFSKFLQKAKKHFGLPPESAVISCYEAGRDGFWIHRWLAVQGVANRVIDSSSIEVDRRRRRAKSDGLDVLQLLSLLQRYELGDRRAFRVVNVPSPLEEDQRHLHRDIKTHKRYRTQCINQIRSLLALQGIRLPKISPALEDQLPQRRDWQQQPLLPGLHDRLARACQRLAFLEQQIEQMESQRRQLLKNSRQGAIPGVRQLMRLRGVGVQTAWLLEHEIFSWRKIQNGKQLGGLLGLTPTPYQSGAQQREQGISKAGNRWVRSVAIELGWMWLLHQPQSELSLWFEKRFGRGGKRIRRIGIVALTRRLLIQLWLYRQYGVIPPGARLQR